METIGIKTLKAQLSAYIAKAHLGERIVITDRGEEPETLAALDERTLTTRHQTGERISV